MKEFSKLSIINKALVILTSVLLFYGYLCRTIGLYFFWESKTIGWELLLITILSLLIIRIRAKKIINRKTLSEKILLGLIIFILLVQCGIVLTFPKSDAYKAAKQIIMTDKSMSREVGVVYDISILPIGQIRTTSNSSGETGIADLHFIVKGKHKFIDFDIQLIKTIDSDWTFISNE